MDHFLFLMIDCRSIKNKQNSPISTSISGTLHILIACAVGTFTEIDAKFEQLLNKLFQYTFQSNGSFSIHTQRTLNLFLVNISFNLTGD